MQGFDNTDTARRLASFTPLSPSSLEFIPPSLYSQPDDDDLLLLDKDQILKDSGLFPLDIREWDRKPNAEKTLPNFKTYFTRANQERIENMTAGQLQCMQQPPVARAYLAVPVGGISMDQALLARNHNVLQQVIMLLRYGTSMDPF